MIVTTFLLAFVSLYKERNCAINSETKSKIHFAAIKEIWKSLPRVRSALRKSKNGKSNSAAIDMHHNWINAQSLSAIFLWYHYTARFLSPAFPFTAPNWRHCWAIKIISINIVLVCKMENLRARDGREGKSAFVNNSIESLSLQKKGDWQWQNN